MFLCQICGKAAVLVLNRCAECDPELHKAWQKAVDSLTDLDTVDAVTPEMVTAYKILESRKNDDQRHR